MGLAAPVDDHHADNGDEDEEPNENFHDRFSIGPFQRSRPAGMRLLMANGIGTG
jgi:hypothetical protein